MIGGKGRAGGGDVNDHFRGSGRRGSFGGTQAFDDAVSRHALFGKKPSGEIEIFGGHPEPAAMAHIKAFGDFIEIGHGGHIKPAFRHGHGNIGKAEIERRQNRHKIFLRQRISPRAGPHR